MAEWTPQERQTAHNQLCNPLRFNNDGSICYTDAIDLACQRNRALAALRRVRFICSNEGHAPCRSGGLSEGEVCANFCGCEWPEEIIPIVDTAIAACEEGK